ncbi:Nucleolar protein 6 [Paramicrosporidium saccamoebae]|uniref:U3 small nucleolar RNA-associated protein 22 n=1 Tax=Paramicrosporidium saccamoebae TaxID=1246581 RepID=A0A2H9TNE8_9FUNG|nr:Nucleolar protein 6 [Paramicrosporidium saccamoebae]
MSSGKRTKSGRDAEKLTKPSSKAVSDLLHAIKENIEKLVEDVLQWSKQQKIRVPFVGLPKVGSPEREKLRFAVMPPTNVTVVGSMLLETMVSPANVDISVGIPKELLEERDEVNYRYFLKRAFYLAKLAECLQKMPELQGAVFGWKSYRGHVLKPLLIVKPKNCDMELCIHASLPSGFFKTHRFSPSKNLVRRGAFLGSEDAQQPKRSLELEGTAEPPTPVYNSLLQSEMTMVSHLKLIHTECKKYPALRDAIKLGKAWAQQRGYPSHNFHFSGFQFTMFCIFLAKNGRISTDMSDMQIFKAVMSLLSETDWTKPIFMAQLDTPHPEDFASSVYSTAFAACLVEPIMGMNILFDWTAEVAIEVTHDAQQALYCLNQPSPDFNSLFLLPDSTVARYDAYYRVSDFTWMPDVQANIQHYLGQFVPEIARVKMISKKLAYGLNSRAKHIFVHSTASPSVSLNSMLASPVDSIGIGLIFNRDECQRIVELGPLADNVEGVKQFRHFWQERSELRRFQDGSIREAVAWDKMRECRHHVCPDIVDFVISKHFQTDSMSCVDMALDFAWSSNAVFAPLQDALQHFTKTMRSIASLPLSISRCETISTTGRLTCIAPPEAIEDNDLFPNKGTLPPQRAVVELLVYLEGSTRWPDEFYGLKYAKQAFAVQICRHLSDHFGLQCSMSSEFFDVLSGGFVFRCYIHHESEVQLMAFHGLDTRIVERRNEQMPKHARMIGALALGDSVFAPTCRLFKKWLASQMYFGQVGEELCELLCAYVFLRDSPPNSVVTGFAAVLTLLMRHTWDRAPLLVDFERTDSKSWEKAEMAYSDASDRPALWIAPSYETDGSVCIWSTMSKLTVQELGHLQQLAGATLNLLGNDEQDMCIMFRPSPSRFNLIITLADLERPTKRIAAVITNGSSEARFLRALPGFDAYELLIADLEKSLPEATFYRGDEFIGVAVDETLDKDYTASVIRKIGGDLISAVTISK